MRPHLFRAIVPALAALATPGLAQSPVLDASVGIGAHAWRTSVAIQWTVIAAGPLHLGAGGRLGYYGGSEQSYRNEGTVTPDLPNHLQIQPSVFGLNLMAFAELDVAGPVGLGANIDLAGLAFGPERTAGNATLQPATWSALLYGSNDRGSLNSEFFVSVKLNQRTTVRGGASHYVVGYSAEAASDETRYLRFETVPFLAVRLHH